MAAETECLLSKELRPVQLRPLPKGPEIPKITERQEFSEVFCEFFWEIKLRLFPEGQDLADSSFSI